MITLEPFKEKHAFELNEQAATFELRSFLDPRMFAVLEINSVYSFTGRNNEGRIVGCGGILKHWNDRGEAWALLDRNCKREFLAIHTHMRRGLEVCPLRRVEAVVNCDFEEGHRWVKALGFKLEAERMEAYFPNGKDCALYARVRSL